MRNEIELAFSLVQKSLLDRSVSQVRVAADEMTQNVTSRDDRARVSVFRERLKELV